LTETNKTIIAERDLAINTQFLGPVRSSPTYTFKSDNPTNEALPWSQVFINESKSKKVKVKKKKKPKKEKRSNKTSWGFTK